MTIRALLLVLLAVGWWRVPAATGGAAPKRALATGAGVVVAAMTVLALVSGPLLDALDVDTETFRIATGLVASAVGVARMWGWGSGREDDAELAAPSGWAWPLAYPVLSGPLTVLAAVSVGSDHGVFAVLAAAVVGAVVTVALGGRSVPRPVAVTAVRLVGALLAVLGVALIFDGLRDV